MFLKLARMRWCCWCCIMMWFCHCDCISGHDLYLTAFLPLPLILLAPGVVVGTGGTSCLGILSAPPQSCWARCPRVLRGSSIAGP